MGPPSFRDHRAGDVGNPFDCISALDVELWLQHLASRAAVETVHFNTGTVARTSKNSPPRPYIDRLGDAEGTAAEAPSQLAPTTKC